MFNFEIIKETKGSEARAGLMKTRHGSVKTPVFMPVGTLASVKSLSPEDLWNLDVQVILGNTYHLYLRPGCEIIRKFSGLHEFMQWHHPILTDSGGFQVFSLGKLFKLTEKGAFFNSHIDGSKHLLSPEKSIEIQMVLNSDIMMCLDECTVYPATLDAAKEALKLTLNWAKRCKDEWINKGKSKNALFGIVQGGMFTDLRHQAADELTSMDFSGYAVGGLSVGEPKDLMLDMAHATLPRLPGLKPRYIMGVGTPEDIVELVSMGADMFDCVLPTRNARNGQLFTNTGTFNITNSRFKDDTDPIEQDCQCYTCCNFSRAYLRHLYMSKELLAYRLNTIHNIFYYTDLMARMREAIMKDEFRIFKNDFYNKRAG